jgi:Ca2+-binding RTX toxin-like protein
MAVRYLTAGIDAAMFDAAADWVRGFMAQLAATDVIAGGDGGARDTLLFYDGVALDFTAGGNASGLSGFELLFLANAPNSVKLSAAFVAGAHVGTAAAGYFTVQGGSGDDLVDASLVGAGQRVAFVAGLGADTFLGGAGNDTAWFAAGALTSADRVQGGAGLDALAISTAGVVAATAFANVSGIERLLLHQGGNTVTLTQAMAASATDGFAVIGGAGSDWVFVTSLFRGIGFTPGGGDDVFLGGAGNDQINIAIADLTAQDRFDGGAGRDRIGFTTAGTITAGQLAGLSSIETLSLSSLGANRVTLSSNLAGVLVAGGSQADTVTMAVATQFASLGAGDDVMIVRASSVPALSSYGKAGFDTIRTVGAGTFTIGAGIVEFEALVMQDSATLDLTATVMALSVTGSAGADVVRLGSGPAQAVDAGAGDDRLELVGETAPGSIFSGYIVDLAAREALYGSNGRHAVLGFRDVTGGVGSDLIQGDAEQNTLQGGGGDDNLAGGGGNDTLAGGAGNDGIDGGAGVDTVDYSAAAGGIVIDMTITSGPQATQDGDGGQDALSGIEFIVGSAHADVIIGNVGVTRIIGGAGDDLFGGFSVGRRDGGAGFDTLDLGAFRFSYIDMEFGEYFAQGIGMELVDIEQVLGTPGGDTLRGDAGQNVFDGRGGDDTVAGGDGDDRLAGGAGSDSVSGGAGNDLFVYAAPGDGGDTIADFTPGGSEDRFVFAADAFALANGQASLLFFTDTTASGLVAPLIDVVRRVGPGSAVDVDLYLAAAAGAPPGGMFVLAQASAGGTAALYYDPDASAFGGAGAAVLLARLDGVTDLSAITAADFLFA